MFSESTSYRYLLDTNILSDLIKNPKGKAAAKIAELGVQAAACCTSLVVACELRYGAYKKGSPALAARVEQLLAILPVLPLEVNMSLQYAEIRTDLERRGQPIRSNDLLIAAAGPFPAAHPRHGQSWRVCTNSRASGGKLAGLRAFFIRPLA
jgi:tRNA(fMet)-specific endonuclease VapC